MPIRREFLRRMAWTLVVSGLGIGLVGEILVIENELLYRELPAQDNLWLWPAVGMGTAMAGLGLLLFVLRRLLRRQFLVGLVKSTRDGFHEH